MNERVAAWSESVSPGKPVMEGWCRMVAWKMIVDEFDAAGVKGRAIRAMHGREKTVEADCRGMWKWGAIRWEPA